MGNFLLQTKLFEICSKTNLNVSETFELFRKRLEMNKNSIYWKLFIWNQLKQMADLLMGRARPQTSAAPAPTRSFLRCDRIKSHEAIYRRARHTRINCIPRATATRLQDEDERRCRPARSRNLQPPLHKTPRRGRERCRPARSRNLQPPLHCAPLGVGVSLCCLPLLRHIGGSPATP